MATVGQITSTPGGGSGAPALLGLAENPGDWEVGPGKSKGKDETETTHAHVATDGDVERVQNISAQGS